MTIKTVKAEYASGRCAQKHQSPGLNRWGFFVCLLSAESWHLPPWFASAAFLLLKGSHEFRTGNEALKAGKRVARSGWNGKGMWLILVPGTPKAELRVGTPYANALQMESCEILPHIDMWTINSEGRRAMLPGWLASQSDMLADDWLIIELA